MSHSILHQWVLRNSWAAPLAPHSAKGRSPMQHGSQTPARGGSIAVHCGCRGSCQLLQASPAGCLHSPPHSSCRPLPAMLDLSERRGQLALAATAAGAAGTVWLCRRYAAAAASGGASAPAATSFDAYLKDRSVGAKPAQQQPKFAPTSFEAYLRQPAPAAAAGAAPGVAAAPPTAKPLTVLFGTEYGFSKEVAEKACEALKEAGYWPQLLDMAELPHGLLGLADGRHQALLLVCSTQVR